MGAIGTHHVAYAEVKITSTLLRETPSRSKRNGTSGSQSGVDSEVDSKAESRVDQLTRRANEKINQNLSQSLLRSKTWH